MSLFHRSLAILGVLILVGSSPCQNAPTAVDNTVTTSEDTAYTFIASEFGFSDVDVGDSLARIQITALESNGMLTLSGGDVTENQEILAADIGNLVFTPVQDANGAAYASFGFKVHDGTEYSASAYTMTVDVTAVQDAPTASDNTVTTSEDTAYPFAASEFGFSDVDAGDSLARIQITALESVGTLELSGADVTGNQEILAADIGNLVFTPAQDANGAAYASFGFKVHDGTQYSTAAYTMTVDVTPREEVGFSIDRPRMEAGQPPAVALRLVDMDGDGLLDQIRLAERSLTILLQDGAGRFRPVAWAADVAPSSGTVFRDVAVGSLQLPLPSGPFPVADVPDLAVLSSNGEIEILTYDGSRLVPASASPVIPFPAPASQILVADIDGMGHDDVVVLLDMAPLLMFMFLSGDGGGFVDVSFTHVLDNFGVSLLRPHGTLADFDGDLDLDLVVVSAAAAPILLENTAGVFSISPAAFQGLSVTASRVLALDLLGDPKPELVLGMGGLAARPPVVLENAGGVFAPQAVIDGNFLLRGVRELLAGDVSGDGRADLIVLQDDGTVHVGTGLGGGAFGATELPLLNAAPRSALALGDLEGDGDLDLCIAGFDFEDQILLGDGKGEFFDTEGADFPIDVAPVNHLAALVDVDGSQDLDLVIYSRRGRPMWFLNDGSARFHLVEDSAALPELPRGLDYSCLKAASVRQPGKRDLVVAGGPGNPAPLRVLVNLGGIYEDQTALRFPITNVNSAVVLAVGPVGARDRPGSELDDLIIADATGHLHLAINVGGVYEKAPGAFPGPPLSGPRRALLGDINLDGDCDVVVLQTGGTVRIFTGDRFGEFSSVKSTDLPDYRARDGELVDLSGDGILDLVLVPEDLLAGLIVLLGDGTGLFHDATSTMLPFQPEGHITGLALVPAESGVHLMVARDDGPDLLLRWRSDVRRFGPPEQLPFRGSVRTTAILVDDLDRDGDADAVILREQSLPGLLRGTRGHLSHNGITQSGRVLSLHVVAPEPQSFVFLFMGVGTLIPAVPLPFPYSGLLRLNGPVPLAQFVLPPGEREADMKWLLPAGLPASEVPIQALFYDLATFELSNLEYAVLTDH